VYALSWLIASALHQWLTLTTPLAFSFSRVTPRAPFGASVSLGPLRFPISKVDSASGRPAANHSGSLLIARPLSLVAREGWRLIRVARPIWEKMGA
jgi:hypothetical protein